MPRKKTAKKTAPSTTNPDAAEEVASALDKVDPNAALAAILSELQKLNGEVVQLKKENEDLKDALVQNPQDGGRRIVDGEDTFDVPRPKDPPPIGTFAVFRSPSPGFRQKLIKSRKIRFENGDTEIEPPVFAYFEKGVCLLKDKKEIEIMRTIEEENRLTGVPVFVEIEDESQKKAALQGKLSNRSIKSQSVTAETSLEELVV